jgi:hypothetical protein
MCVSQDLRGERPLVIRANERHENIYEKLSSISSAPGLNGGSQVSRPDG